MKLSTYLGQLRRNNNREWFNAHREEYDEVRERWYQDLDRLVSLMSEWEPRMTGIPGKRISYRIYRDVRFSSDKTPYKDYFSACPSPYSKSLQTAQYYIHAGAPGQESMTAAGLWCPDASQLKKMRRAIIDNIEEFEDIIHEPELMSLYPEWYGQRLKTAPKGWPKDHPHIELLRLTQYGKLHELNSSFYDHSEWPERASELLRPLKPLVDFINYSLEEE